MPNQFDRDIPKWNSQDNQGAGLEIANLTRTSQKDLVVFQIDSFLGLNQGLYKIGKNINAQGDVSGGWTEWIAVPDWQSFENQGGDIAIADLTGTGRLDLIVFQIDNPVQLNRGLYKIGKNIDANGIVQNGWTDWLEIPDWQSWENQGGSISVADLSGTVKKDLIVFAIDNPPGLNRGRYKIGRDLKEDGSIAGGWTDWHEVPEWFSWENVDAGVAIADLDNSGNKDLIIFQVDNGIKQNQGFFKIGKNIDPDGKIQGLWTPSIPLTQDPPTSGWYGVPAWKYWENQGAGIVVTNLGSPTSHEAIVLAVDNPVNGAENIGSYQVLLLDNDPKTQGSWELLSYKSEVLPVHAALLPKGKVLFASGSGNNGVRFNNPNLGDIDKKIYCSVVWDYATSNPAQRFVHPNTLKDASGKVLDLFCGGETLLADGKLLAAGGTQSYDVDAVGNGNGQPFKGRREIMAFDPNASLDKSWTDRVDMADGRWYPTLLTLGNRKVLIAAGLDKNGKANPSLEIFTPDNGRGQIATLPLPPQGFKILPAYPHLFLLQDGSVFFSGGKMDDAESQAPPYLLNLALDPIGVKQVENLEFADSRNQSTSVLLPPAQDQKVIIMGGATPNGEDNAIDSVNIIDLSNPAIARYQTGKPMLLPRVHLNAVILPDRTVFVCGGALQREGGAAGDRKTTGRFQAELYHPETDTWSLAATAKIERLYHSVALLLPDGKVVAASGNPDKATVADWTENDNEELSLEIYSPPYLFQGARPAIGIVKEAWKYGETIDIAFTHGIPILWATLIRNGVVTHSFNTDQRSIDLEIISQGVGVIKVKVTDRPNLAPPGWYMLFLTDRNRIPSVASWVLLS